MLILLELWRNEHIKSLIITHDIVAKMQQVAWLQQYSLELL